MIFYYVFLLQNIISKDPLLVATQIYQSIQGFINRNYDAFNPIVLSITKLYCGEAINAIADRAFISGTLRTLDKKLKKQILSDLKNLVTYIAKAYNMNAILKLDSVSHLPTINAKRKTQKAIKAAQKTVGIEKVDRNYPPQLTSEDFNYFLDKVPDCYGFTGKDQIEKKIHMDYITQDITLIIIF